MTSGMYTSIFQAARRRGWRRRPRPRRQSFVVVPHSYVLTMCNAENETRTIYPLDESLKRQTERAKETEGNEMVEEIEGR